MLHAWRGLNQTQQLVVGLGLLIVVAAVVAVLFPRPADAPTTQAANPYTVWRICQERVSAELKAPSTADFPSYSEQAVSHSGALWTVSSYVDAQNSFGAKLRTRYTCTARFNPADATYSIESVSVS